MSALFPNVPDVLGVPAINRAPATILSAINGATQSRLAAQTGLDELNVSDTVSASGSFGLSRDLAQQALSLINPVFSPASIPTAALYGATGSGQAAVNAIAAGDIGGAIRAGQDAINYATDAIDSMRNILNPSGETPLTTGSAAMTAAQVAQWGLYTQDGSAQILVDNIVSLEAIQEAVISDYPVENGGFATYNKVIKPFDIRLGMSRGGTVEDRQDFAQAINDAWMSTDLFNVVTPEVVYLDMNVVGVRRLIETDRGVGLMTLDVMLRKVRQTAKLSFASTKEPASAGTNDDGAVQTQKTPWYGGTAD